jgi:hypothetical protein
MGTEKRVRREMSEWRRLVALYEASGLNQNAFCAREGISANTFRIWKERLKAEGKAGKPAPTFVELTPPGRPEAGPWAVEVELPHGIVLRMRG